MVTTQESEGSCVEIFFRIGGGARDVLFHFMTDRILGLQHDNVIIQGPLEEASTRAV